MITKKQSLRSKKGSRLLGASVKRLSFYEICNIRREPKTNIPPRTLISTELMQTLNRKSSHTQCKSQRNLIL